MADKITLNELASLDSPTGANTNFSRIESAFDNTLSRDGTGPNQMEADFDLNSYDIINGGTAAFASLTVAGVQITGSGGGGGGGAGSIIIDGNSSTRLVATGTGVSSSYDPSTGTTTFTFTAGSGGGDGGNPIQIESEGVALTSAVTKINIEGAGVTVTEPVADEILITIPGSSGGSGGVVTDVEVASFADLQAAITAAAGGTIFITQDWNVSSQLNIPANTQIFGAGGSFTNTANIVMFNTANGAQIKNLSLIGSGTSASPTTQDVAISVASGAGVIIQDCTFTNFKGYSIYLNASVHTTLRNLKFVGAGNYCVYGSANTQNTIIESLDMDGCAGGVNLTGTSGNEITNTQINGIKWDGTGTTGSLHLFNFDYADGGQISNVEAVYIRGRASNMSNSDYWTVSNNHITDACQDGATDYVFSYTDCWRWSYVLQVYNDETSGPSYGYFFSGTNIGLVWTACEIRSVGGSIGSDVSNGTTYSRGNIINSSGLSFIRWVDKTPSSSTLSIDSYNARYRIIGSSVTIININGGYVGQRIALRSNASGNVVISNSGNIKTPESGTLILSPNGSVGAAFLELEKVGTNVWEVIGTQS